MDRRFTTGALGSRYTAPKTTAPKTIKTSRPQTTAPVSAYDKLRQQGLTHAQVIAKLQQANKPKVVIAAQGDTFDSLSDKYGVKSQDLVKANPDVPYPMGGTAMNIPNIKDFPEAGRAKATDPNAGFTGFRYDETSGVNITQQIADYNALNNPQTEIKTPWWEKAGQFIQNILPTPLTPEEAFDTTIEGLNSAGDYNFYPTPTPTSYDPMRGKVASPMNLPRPPWDEGEPIHSQPQQRPPAEYADFRQAEAEAARLDSAGFPAPGRDPFPYKPGEFQFSEGTNNIYQAASQQMKDIYETDPTIRYGKFGFDILGLEAFDGLGNKEAIAEIGFEPFMRPFTVNFLQEKYGVEVELDEYGNIVGGTLDTSKLPDKEVQRLIDLGYLEPPGSGTSVGGWAGSGYGRGGSRSVPGRSAPQPLYQNPSYLGLTSWSI